MRVLSILSLFVLTGCYAYYPVTAGTPAEGSRIRAYPADPRLEELTGPRGPMVMELDGYVIDVDDDSLGLYVQSVRTNLGLSTVWNGSEFALPRSSIQRLEERRFSRSRTLLFIGAAIGASVLLDHWLGNPIGGLIEGENDTQGPPTGTT